MYFCSLPTTQTVDYNLDYFANKEHGFKLSNQPPPPRPHSQPQHVTNNHNYYQTPQHLPMVPLVQSHSPFVVHQQRIVVTPMRVVQPVHTSTVVSLTVICISGNVRVGLPRLSLFQGCLQKLFFVGYRTGILDMASSFTVKIAGTVFSCTG